MEKNIIWLPREEKLSFWYDEWIKQGPRYKHMPSDVKPMDVLLKDVSEENSWQYEKIEDEIPHSVKNIVDHQHLILSLKVPEKVIWTTNSTRVFSVASTWNCLAGPCGILMDGMQLMQVVHNWWNHKTTNIIVSFMVKLLLALIIWKLWRSRCAYKYENEAPLVCMFKSLIFNTLSNLTSQKLGKVKFEDILESNTKDARPTNRIQDIHTSQVGQTTNKFCQAQ